MEALSEVRVKDEQIDDSQSISDTRKEATSRNNQPNKITNNEQSIKHEREFIPISETNKRTREYMSIDDQPKLKRQSVLVNKVKEEPIDIEMQTSQEIVVKSEEKFSATQEFENKTSIAFLNEEETTTTITNLRNKKPK